MFFASGGRFSIILPAERSLLILGLGWASYIDFIFRISRLNVQLDQSAQNHKASEERCQISFCFQSDLQQHKHRVIDLCGVGDQLLRDSILYKENILARQHLLREM